MSATRNCTQFPSLRGAGPESWLNGTLKAERVWGDVVPLLPEQPAACHSLQLPVCPRNRYSALPTSSPEPESST